MCLNSLTDNINFGPNTKKYQDPIARISGYKLLNCVADRYSKPYKTHFGEDAIYKFLNDMKYNSQYGN